MAPMQTTSGDLGARHREVGLLAGIEALNVGCIDVAPLVNQSSPLDAFNLIKYHQSMPQADRPIVQLRMREQEKNDGELGWQSY